MLHHSSASVTSFSCTSAPFSSSCSSFESVFDFSDGVTLSVNDLRLFVECGAVPGTDSPFAPGSAVAVTAGDGDGVLDRSKTGGNEPTLPFALNPPFLFRLPFVLLSRISTLPFSKSEMSGMSGISGTSGISIAWNRLPRGVFHAPCGSQLGRTCVLPPLPLLDLNTSSSREPRLRLCMLCSSRAWLAADNARARRLARIIVPIAPKVPRSESKPGSSVF
ncbi:hypothetical protein BDW22DRAFT_62582 [Trametopsis cervina]|nr:hypothetical protein BDW22DRAFT_62582 [Trametopsis cervina]